MSIARCAPLADAAPTQHCAGGANKRTPKAELLGGLSRSQSAPAGIGNEFGPHDATNGLDGAEFLPLPKVRSGPLFPADRRACSCLRRVFGSNLSITQKAAHQKDSTLEICITFYRYKTI